MLAAAFVNKICSWKFRSFHTWCILGHVQWKTGGTVIGNEVRCSKPSQRVGRSPLTSAHEALSVFVILLLACPAAQFCLRASFALLRCVLLLKGFVAGAST